MRGVLQFNLPEERDDFMVAANAGHVVDILTTFENWLRSKEDCPDNMDGDTIAIVREQFRIIIVDSGVADLIP